jgi:hypothetical protein
MGVDRARIESAHAEFRKITDSGDWSGFADLFAEEGTFVNSLLAEPIRGREAIRAFAAHWPVVVNHAEWVVIDGNRLAVGWNERQQAMPDDAPPYRGISTFVFDDDGLVASYEGMFDPATLPTSPASES